MVVKPMKWWETPRTPLGTVAHFASHHSVSSNKNISLRSFLMWQVHGQRVSILQASVITDDTPFFIERGMSCIK